LIAIEMGKPVRDGWTEIEKCAWVCDYYADNALTALQPETIRTDARRSYISFKPLGVILAIMPWNYPFWQVFRFAAPALMAGNAAVLKHASNVPGCSLAIEDVFKTAGIPKDLFQNLLLASPQVDRLVKDPLIQAVTMMGSQAGGGRRSRKLLKKTVLELGDGAFYPATVIDNVQKGMPAYDEETFGPVAAVIAVANEAEAIRTANDSPLGLGVAIFTGDVDRGERIAANQLEAGNCFVNASVKSDPRLPFGGIKQSGYGRELFDYGIKEFVNIKTVYVG